MSRLGEPFLKSPADFSCVSMYVVPTPKGELSIRKAEEVVEPEDAEELAEPQREPSFGLP